MQRAKKIIRLFLQQEDGESSFFPVVMDAEKTLWEAVAPILPPWADPDEWILTDCDGNSDVKELSTDQIRGGAWFYAGPAEGVLKWRESIPDSASFGDLDLEIYHRSLISVRKHLEVDLPDCRFVQIEVSGGRADILHEEGLFSCEDVNDPDFQEILRFEKSKKAIGFERREAGHLFLLYADGVEHIGFEQSTKRHESLLTLSPHEPPLTGIACRDGKIWLINTEGELFCCDQQRQRSRPCGNVSVCKAVFSPKGWLIFDAYSKGLFLVDMAGDQRKILEDHNGSFFTFCQDASGIIYYLNSEEGLRILHPDKGLIATVGRRDAYTEGFNFPRAMDVNGNRLFVIEDHKLLIYELDWEGDCGHNTFEDLFRAKGQRHDDFDRFFNLLTETNRTAGNEGQYETVIMEKGAVNFPFKVNTEVAQTASEIVKDCHDDLDRARVIFEWFQKNVQYGESIREKVGSGYFDALEVFTHKQGVCGEMAILYCSMARMVGLKASYVSVKKDYEGEEVSHACAGVEINGRHVLVDPAYHSFDIKHQEYDVLSDESFFKKFSSWDG